MRGCCWWRRADCLKQSASAACLRHLLVLGCCFWNADEANANKSGVRYFFLSGNALKCSSGGVERCILGNAAILSAWWNWRGDQLCYRIKSAASTQYCVNVLSSCSIWGYIVEKHDCGEKWPKRDLKQQNISQPNVHERYRKWICVRI